ncbi:MAG: anti-sigma factor domain-containing protein [Solirubrobacterales bacterium]
MTGEHPDRDDLVAYSLEALDPRKAAEIEAHVPGCARCTRELEALAPAVAVLGESVEQVEPPPELRERVLGIVRDEAEAKQAELSGARGREEAAARRERRGWRGLLMRPAVGLAGLAIVGAGVGGYLVADEAGNGGGESTVPVVAQAGIGGTLAVGDQSSMLDLHGLKHHLTGHQVYQVWVAQDSGIRPSSNFIPNSTGHALTAVDGHLSSGTKVMVTLEPRPGETAPTTPVLLNATVE